MEIDMNELCEEIGEVVYRIVEMVESGDMRPYCKKVPYLEVGILEARGADGFANFIAEFSDEFEIVDFHIGHAAVKVKNVFFVLLYSCEWGASTCFRWKVCDSLLDAQEFYARCS